MDQVGQLLLGHAGGGPKLPDFVFQPRSLLFLNMKRASREACFILYTGGSFCQAAGKHFFHGEISAWPHILFPKGQGRGGAGENRKNTLAGGMAGGLSPMAGTAAGADYDRGSDYSGA